MQLNIKKIIVLTIIIFPFTASADPLSNLINQMKEAIKDPALITLDYSEPKYLRSNEKNTLISLYKSRTDPYRSLMSKLLTKAFKDKIEENQQLINEKKTISITEILPYFEKLKESGETLKTGDYVMISSKTGYSVISKTFLGISYSHTGMVWIKNDMPYIVQIHPHADLLITSLLDFIFAKNPDNFALTIYRYEGEIDRIEMSYIFQIIEKNKNNILFDDLFQNDILIENPETYFSKHKFLYCTELPYLCYKWCVKEDDFIDKSRIDYRDLISKMIKIDDPMIQLALNFLISTFKNNINSSPITCQNFINSKYFKEILTYDKDIINE